MLSDYLDLLSVSATKGKNWMPDVDQVVSTHSFVRSISDVELTCVYSVSEKLQGKRGISVMGLQNRRYT